MYKTITEKISETPIVFLDPSAVLYRRKNSIFDDIGAGL